MAQIERVKPMEKSHTIVEAVALPPHGLRLQWSDGTQADIDISNILAKKAYAPLLDKKRFRKVQVGEWGHSLIWPGEIELGADSLWRLTLLANGREDTVAFLDWRLRHGLSLSGAAKALGLSRRMIAYYSSGERRVPRTVLLACKGWEVEAA